MKNVPVLLNGDTVRQDWIREHFWLLGLAVLSVLTVGMALLMHGDVQQKALFGFCGLSVLVLCCLIDRQMLVRNLRKEVEEDRTLIMRIRQKSSTDLLQTLPGLQHFQDLLTMEHRRAVSTNEPLSVVLVVLKPTVEGFDPGEGSIALGDAAKALLAKLRGEDSVFLLSSGLFGVLLPGVEEANAKLVSAHLAEGLRNASNVSNRFSYDIQTLNYPERVKSAREIEEAVRTFLQPNAVTPNID